MQSLQLSIKLETVTHGLTVEHVVALPTWPHASGFATRAGKPYASAVWVSCYVPFRAALHTKVCREVRSLRESLTLGWRRRVCAAGGRAGPVHHLVGAQGVLRARRGRRERRQGGSAPLCSLRARPVRHRDLHPPALQLQPPPGDAGVQRLWWGQALVHWPDAGASCRQSSPPDESVSALDHSGLRLHKTMCGVRLL